MKEINTEDLKRIQTYPLSSRKSLSTRADFGAPAGRGESLKGFLEKLPNIYMAKSLKRVAARMSECRATKRAIHFAMGSHVLKNGLSPYLIDLMRAGYCTAVSFNGSALIHDFEISYVGATSEDVDSALGEGKFGLAKETAEILNEATVKGVGQGWGLGRSVGEWIRKECPHAKDSVLAVAVELGLPVTVHVAIGTDIIHIHPSFNVEAAGRGSYRDFLTFATAVANLEGGIYLNVGSAVILPEIFLKALSLARNLGHTVESFTAVNLDFIRQYRPRRNVLERPTAKGGEAIEIIGPHELTIPLLHAAVRCGEE